MRDEEATEPARRQIGTGAMAELIVGEIINDLTDRGGFRQEWDSTDADVQAEIRDAWMLIARRVIELGR